MQTTSALYQTLIASENHWFETKLVIDNVGEFDESQLFSIDIGVQVLQNSPSAGFAPSGEINIKMLLPNATIPTMACLRPYVRVCGNEQTIPDAEITDDILYNGNGTIANDIWITDGASIVTDIITFADGTYQVDTSEWIPQGVYYIDTRKRTKNDDGLDLLTIHGYDAMLKAEREYPNTTHDWPYRDTLVIQEIASTMGVSVDSRVNGYINKGYMIDLPISYSMRETLCHIGAAYGGSFVMSAKGALLFVPIYGLI